MEIRNYRPSDLDALLIMSHQFETSPFTFDNRIYDQRSEMDPVFAREMLIREGTHTFVLEKDRRILGFISISVNIPLSKVLNKTISSILLLVVDRQYRQKGLGKYLVTKALESMNQLKVDIFTVGTDLYNIPAINSYERNGFTTRMTWHIYRWYQQSKSGILSPDIDIIKPAHLPLYKNIFERPISLLHEPDIDKTTLKQYLWESFLSKKANNPYPILELVSKGESRALIQVQPDTLSMRSLDTDENIYRISDLLIRNREQIDDIGTSILTDLKSRFKDGLYLEYWVQSYDKAKIHLLESNGFQLSYSGISLHKVSKN